MKTIIRKTILLLLVIILIIVSFIGKCDEIVNPIDVSEEVSNDNCDFLRKISGITNSSPDVLSICKRFNQIFEVKKDGEPILTPQTMENKIKSWLNNQQDRVATKIFGEWL